MGNHIACTKKQEKSSSLSQYPEGKNKKGSSKKKDDLLKPNSKSSSNSINSSSTIQEPIQKESLKNKPQQISDLISLEQYSEILGLRKFKSEIIEKCTITEKDSISIKKSKEITISQQQQRLQAEQKSLSRNVPINATNSIFICQNSKNQNHLQALITGVQDTPYAYGIFIFEIFCHYNFPQKPPEMKLLTTGKNKVRFNPNLYDSGYVCLSLLGTWPGRNPKEEWTPQSSILQSLVMTSDVIDHEPNYSYCSNRSKYQQLRVGYDNIIKFSTLKYAIIEILQNPPNHFKEEIKVHFYLNKTPIIQTVQKWVQEAYQQDVEPKYDSLTYSHNPQTAQTFSQSKLAFYNNLQILQQQLMKELDKLKLPIIQKISFVQEYVYQKSKKEKHTEK